MSEGLDSLPPPGQGYNFQVAGELVEIAIHQIRPVGDLESMWDEYVGMIQGFLDGTPIEFSFLQYLRIGLESLEGDQRAGELLIAISRLGFDTLLLAAPNPYVALLNDRDEIHNDLMPLIDKGLTLAQEASSIEPYDPSVRLNWELPERMEKSQKKSYVGMLIENAVRPGDRPDG